MAAISALVTNVLLFACFWIALYGDRAELKDPVICRPPCKNGEVICTWDSGGNGFNGSTDCQRKCGAPVGNGQACSLSANRTCYWGWREGVGWACFSGPVPCSPNGTVFDSAYLPCAEFDRDYGGCGDCSNCCSHKCHCQDLIEDKSECVCG